ncbi:hypothetical protein YC2023_116995 [Brassica napus]
MTDLCGALVGVGGTDDTEDEELAEIFDSAHKISGFKYITNTGGSQICFDDDIPEIQDFKSRSPSQPFLFNKIYHSRLHEIDTIKIG